MTSRYDGFTCPVCGRHEFSSNEYKFDTVTKKWVKGDRIGTCAGYQFDPMTSCRFSWNMSDPAENDKVMYQASREELLAQISGMEKNMPELENYAQRHAALVNMVQMEKRPLARSEGPPNEKSEYNPFR